jgi:hypothetical protein
MRDLIGKDFDEMIGVAGAGVQPQRVVEMGA